MAFDEGNDHCCDDVQTEVVSRKSHLKYQFFIFWLVAWGLQTMNFTWTGSFNITLTRLSVFYDGWDIDVKYSCFTLMSEPFKVGKENEYTNEEKIILAGKQIRRK